MLEVLRRTVGSLWTRPGSASRVRRPVSTANTLVTTTPGGQLSTLSDILQFSNLPTNARFVVILDLWISGDLIAKNLSTLKQRMIIESQ